MNMFDKLMQLSLGQGQGKKADKMIKDALVNGEWVMLQNCHLCQSWMEDLEKWVLSFGDMDEEQIHKDFRLFLTSMPAPFFPVSVL